MGVGVGCAEGGEGIGRCVEGFMGHGGVLFLCSFLGCAASIFVVLLHISDFSLSSFDFI